MDALLLNGRWELYHFEEDVYSVNHPDGLASIPVHSIPAQVPGNVELDLVAAGELSDPFLGTHIRDLRELEYHEWWYRRQFSLPARANPAEWDLVCEGIDTLATIWINGIEVGKTENSLIAHRMKVTQALRWGAANTIAVRIRSALNAARNEAYDASQMSWEHRAEGLYLRKPAHCWGWDIMPRAVSAGIWRSMCLEAHPENAFESMYYWTASINESGAVLGAAFQFRTDRSHLDGLSVRFSGKCGEHAFTYDWPVEFLSDFCAIPVKGARLWWPRGYGEPALYTITAQLISGGNVLAERTERVGLRKMEIDRTERAGKVWSFTGQDTSPARVDRSPDADSHFLIKVNGQPIMVKGTNWVPLDAFHSRDVGRTQAAMELVKDLGCNMIRCWGGNVYESDAFFDLVDENGVMVWEDFAFACARYPQTEPFLRVVRDEAEAVVARLRNHASLAIWCGDNEIDIAYLGEGLSPETNRLTREVIPLVLNRLDPHRAYVPSSPYTPPSVAKGPDAWQATPEQHLWGPRGYYKSPFYTAHSAHFIGEIGYHGCPNVSSIKKFISQQALWPWQANDEWLAHSVNHWQFASRLERDRITLMVNQVVALFGETPESLDDLALASQITQAEAKKFFIESTRLRKWGTSGIIWWNLLDGWPQFSDAVVDYYFGKKLAYHYIKRSQSPVLLIVGELNGTGHHPLVISNDSLAEAQGPYRVVDADSQVVLSEGDFACPPNQNWQIDRLKGDPDGHKMLILEWTSTGKVNGSHYLMGKAPFLLKDYRRWLSRVAELPDGFDALKVGQ